MASAPDPKNPSHKTRRHQLRKAERDGQQLHSSDQLWASEYDEIVARGRPSPAAVAADVGASRSGATRSVRFEMDEAQQAEAIGVGPTAAAIAAGAALQAKEEGRRLDSLTMHSIDALKEAVAVYRDMCLMLQQRTEILENAHVDMLNSVRTHHIEATQLEAALTQRETEQQQQQKPEDQMLTMLMAHYLGVSPDQLPKVARPPGPPTKPNGKPPRRPPVNGAPAK